MRLPDIQTLRLFLSVHELHSLTKAAQGNNIAVSAVTKRLKELEANYGVLLFERQPRGVRPTAAGDELARHVQQLFIRIDQIAQHMSEFSEGSRGRVRIAATASSLLGGLSALIRDFACLNEHFHFEVQEKNSLENVIEVLQGRADIGFAAGHTEIPEMLERHLVLRDRLCMVVQREDKLAAVTSIEFISVLDQRLIGLGAASALSLQLEQMALDLGRTLTFRQRALSVDVLRSMVATGLGICILPDSMVRPYEDVLGLRAIPLSDAWAAREILMCFSAERMSPSTRSFVEFLLRRSGQPGEDD